MLNRLTISQSLITIIPVIILIPIFTQIFFGMHMGGLNIFLNFLISSLMPSFRNEILLSSWNGIQITFGIAIISWVISLIFGILLGVLSSYSFYRIHQTNPIFAILIRRFLCAMELCT